MNVINIKYNVIDIIDEIDVEAFKKKFNNKIYKIIEFMKLYVSENDE